VDEAIAGTGIEILRIKNNRIMTLAMGGMGPEETLDDLAAIDVFTRCLDVHGVPEEQRPALVSAYREVVVSLSEADPMAG
jgi:exonuclease SbcD